MNIRVHVSFWIVCFVLFFFFFFFRYIPRIRIARSQPVHSEGDQPWDFFGRNDAKAETPVLWPPDKKSWLIGKDSDAGKDWGQEQKGKTEDEMVGWHHWLNRHAFEQTLGDSEGQGSLVSCSPCGCKELDTTEQLNNKSLKIKKGFNKS